MVVAITCREEGIPFAGMTVDVEAEPNDEQAKLDDFIVTIKMPEKLTDEQRRTVENAQMVSKVRATIAAGSSVTVTVA